MQKKQSSKARAATKGLNFVVFLALAMFAEAASAAPSFFEPVSGDKSLQSFLVPIFGDLFGTGGGSTPLMALFSLFNGAALTIGGMLAAYTLVAGTMQTAHDGEMLGKRWSSMWLPIRTALGVGLVVPLGSGYCVAQMLVGWLAIQGIGLADQLWTGFANATFTQQGMTPTAIAPSVNTLARKLLKNLVCVEAGNKLRASSGSAAAINGFTYSATDYTPPPNSDPMTGTVYDAGPVTGRQYGFPGSESICGTMSFDSVKVPVNTGNAFEAITTNQNDRGLANRIIDAHKKGALVMESRLKTLASQVVTDGGTPNINEINAAALEYQLGVAAAARDLFGSGDSAFDKIKQSATSDGWIMAGAWFMRIAALQDVMNKATSATPEATSPANLEDQGFVPYYARLEGMMSNNPTAIGFQRANSFGEESDANGKIKSWSRAFMQSMASKFSIDPNRHPIMAAKDFGDTVMVATETAIFVGLAALGTTSVLSLGTASGIVSVVGSLMLMLTLPLFAFGAGLAIYIPMVPFIVFFGASVGWVLLVAEAVIAAPLWAIMHLAPSGDDVMGGARQGYMLLLGLLLRPALLIFGFAMCLIGVEPVLKFYNMLFFPVFFASMGDSLVGVFSLMIGLGIYFGTMTFFMHKIFGLIHVIPDQLMAWIGGSGSQLGSYGGGASEAGKGSKAAMAQALTTGASAVSQSVGNVANRAQQDRLGAQRQNDSNNQQMQEKISTASSGGKSAMGGAEAAMGNHESAMSSGSGVGLAQSGRANSHAYQQISEQQGAMTQAASAARAHAQTPGGRPDAAKLNEQADRLDAEAKGLEPEKAAAKENAMEAFGELNKKADAAQAAAAAPGATDDQKQEAATLSKMAMNTARNMNEASPDIGKAIGAPAQMARHQAAHQALISGLGSQGSQGDTPRDSTPREYGGKPPTTPPPGAPGSDV